MIWRGEGCGRANEERGVKGCGFVRMGRSEGVWFSDSGEVGDSLIS